MILPHARGYGCKTEQHSISQSSGTYTFVERQTLNTYLYNIHVILMHSIPKRQYHMQNRMVI